MKGVAKNLVPTRGDCIGAVRKTDDINDNVKQAIKDRLWESEVQRQREDFKETEISKQLDNSNGSGGDRAGDPIKETSTNLGAIEKENRRFKQKRLTKDSRDSLRRPAMAHSQGLYDKNGSLFFRKLW